MKMLKLREAMVYLRSHRWQAVKTQPEPSSMWIPSPHSWPWCYTNSRTSLWPHRQKQVLAFVGLGPFTPLFFPQIVSAKCLYQANVPSTVGVRGPHWEAGSLLSSGMTELAGPMLPRLLLSSGHKCAIWGRQLGKRSSLSRTWKHPRRREFTDIDVYLCFFY